jgi:endonuclease YncB( thermonuclease family)
MKKYQWTLIVLLSFSVLSFLLNLILLHALYSGSKVVSVYDGDSFELADGRRVRLLGVDAPEKGRCGYEEAKKELNALVFGKSVRLKNNIVDDYGRIVANVIMEDPVSWTKYITWWFSRKIGIERPIFDTMVNRNLVSRGLVKNLSVASPYKSSIDQASTDAKARGLGIYSAQCRSALPRSNCTIKGNLQPEGKVYFKPTCPYYTQVVVDESFGDVWLCSESQALSLGFTLSKKCRSSLF